MHTIIAALVYAKDQNEARLRARGVFEKLVRECAFDDCTLLDERTMNVLPANWRKYPMVVKATSREGKQFIQDRLQATRRRFAWALGKVREAVTHYTDDDLCAGTDDFGGVKQMFRYYCLVIGRTHGPDVFLYDHEAEGICTKDHLANVLNKWSVLYGTEEEENPFQHLDVWVVSGFTHY